MHHRRPDIPVWIDGGRTFPPGFMGAGRRGIGRNACPPEGVVHFPWSDAADAAVRAAGEVSLRTRTTIWSSAKNRRWRVSS
jgi:hypothetical protein